MLRTAYFFPLCLGSRSAGSASAGGSAVGTFADDASSPVLSGWSKVGPTVARVSSTTRRSVSVPTAAVEVSGSIASGFGNFSAPLTRGSLPLRRVGELCQPAADQVVGQLGQSVHHAVVVDQLVTAAD
jgi:hypothetical protein